MKSLAVAYGMKKRKKMSDGGTLGDAIGYPKKMAEGGSVDSWTKREDNEKGVNQSASAHSPGKSQAGVHVRAAGSDRALSQSDSQDSMEAAKRRHSKTLAEMKAMPKPDLMAQGGCAGDSCPGCKMCMGGYADGGTTPDPKASPSPDPNAWTKNPTPYGDPISNLKSGLGFAQGGKVQMMTDDLVDRIMAKRANCAGDSCPGCVHCVDSGMAEGGEAMHPSMSKMRSEDYGTTHSLGEFRSPYSKGGRVANEMGEQADEMPAEFDDLALRDHLESTQKSDGDELGDAREDEDRHDIVARIMKQRKMKQHNPRPA